MQACHELLGWHIPHLDSFPRARRFTLGERLEGGLLGVLEDLVDAAFSRGKSAALARANRRLEVVRHLWRLCHELKVIPASRYERGVASRFNLDCTKRTRTRRVRCPLRERGRQVVNDLLEQHKPAIAAVCRRYQVSRLEVFGSAARGDDFDPLRSDIDLLVEFVEGPGALSLGQYFSLREELASLLGHRVDLVMPGAVRNPFVRAEIDRSRVPLYAA